MAGWGLAPAAMASAEPIHAASVTPSSAVAWTTDRGLVSAAPAPASLAPDPSGSVGVEPAAVASLGLAHSMTRAWGHRPVE